MKILIFAGSTRHKSFNRQLAHAVAAMAKTSGLQATLLELADLDIPMYNADLEATGTPPDVLRFKQLLWEHQAWMICTPEYNGSYPALLKNALDWASSPVKGNAEWADGNKPFRGKVVGVLSASPGALGGLRAQSHLVPLLLNSQCWVAPKTFALGHAGDAFSEDGQIKQPAQAKGVEQVLNQVAWAAGRLADGGGEK